MISGGIVVLLTFAIMVLVHEFGHLITSKYFGINVREFAIGFGPKLFSRTWRGTEYSIRMIPLGGFNDIEIDREKQGENDFYGKVLWKRLVVLFAGSGFNIASAYVALLLCVLCFGVPQPSGEIVGVVPESVAASSFEAGDKIVSINGEAFDGRESSNSIKKLSSLHFKVERNGEILEFDVAKTAGETLGVMLGFESKFVPLTESFSAAGRGWINIFSMFRRGIAQIVNNEVAVTEALSGPVGVSTVIYKANEMHGFYGVLVMFAAISVNLGIVNLLPIPCLDGGHIVLQTADSIINKLFGKNFSERQVEFLTYVGATLLGALFLMGLYADIVRLTA